VARLALPALVVLLAAAPPAAAQPAAAAPAAAQPAAPQPVAAVQVTPKVAAPCAAHSDMLPVTLADVDGDGRMERASFVRDGAHLVVRLHEVPGLRVKRTWRIPGDHLEAAVTRHAGARTGDLWLHVTKMDRATKVWSQELWQLVRGDLRIVFRGPGTQRPNLRLDLDGDGRPDPILTTDAGAQALLGGKVVPLPAVRYPDGVHGVRAAHGLETASDLVGDGGRHVVAVDDRDVRVLALPDLRVVARREGGGAVVSVVRWLGQPAIAYYGKNGNYLLGRGLRPIIEPTPARYAVLLPGLDPDGDGARLAMNVGGVTALMDRRGPDALVRLRAQLAGSADPAVARLGPVRLGGAARPGLVGVRSLSFGNPSVGGIEAGEYELVVLPPGGAGDGRVIRRAKVAGEGGGSPLVLDLDGDGRHEILVAESGSYMTCDMKGGGGTSKLLLVDGDGRVLWQDEPRYHSFDRYPGGTRTREARARARVLDLAGDGTLAIQIRTPTEEWYVLPARSPLRGALPACLE
jgi:hypothetical protein